MSDALIVGIIAAIAGLLSPVIGWLLNRQGISRRTRELESLKSRIDFIEKLSKSKEHHTQLDDDIEKLTLREMKAVLAEVDALSEAGRAMISFSGSELNKWQRLTLSYEQISLKGRVYKGLFYAFSFFSFSGVLASLSVATKEEIVFTFIGGSFYLIIALVFRSAAIRTYEVDKRIAGKVQSDG
ncbi:hypothetical protein WCX72_04055 [Sulfurimonas sp. HSL1-6]|uniref:hypothetical protein n=1 Tax=Thiomicrolovo immobilis TaxID=3131935 RepID=UPI0031F77801